MEESKPFRVLSLDGGGMRGVYTATYLNSLCDSFAKKRSEGELDLGGAFDLIVGTSTGGIIACALAAGIQLNEVASLYREHGRKIFKRQAPKTFSLSLLVDHFFRSRSIAQGASSLRKTLVDILGSETLRQVYERRNIGLAIPAVNMSNHRSWVFKTNHLEDSSDRDGGYSLVDICMATSAAPVFRSMEILRRTDGNGSNVFVDGGLWANNPVLVAMVDAVQMATSEQRIEIFCIGTCPLPAGEQILESQIHRGLAGWKFGSEVANIAIAAQEFAYDNIARILSKYTHTAGCEVLRFPRDQTPADMMKFLSLDDTRNQAIDALINQARTDADMTYSKCGRDDDREGRMICRLFTDIPPRKPCAQ